MDNRASEILSGFDRAIDRIETLPINNAEKKRLIKEWLRSRLAEFSLEKMTDVKEAATDKP